MGSWTHSSPALVSKMLESSCLPRTNTVSCLCNCHSISNQCPAVLAPDCDPDPCGRSWQDQASSLREGKKCIGYKHLNKQMACLWYDAELWRYFYSWWLYVTGLGISTACHPLPLSAGQLFMMDFSASPS